MSILNIKEGTRQSSKVKIESEWISMQSSLVATLPENQGK